LTQPEWRAHGYTGAVLIAVKLSTPGEPDRTMIIKVCPPGPYAREATAHQQAKVHSDPTFFAKHLVEQVFDPYPVGDGGYLTFQELAGGTFGFRPLSDVSDEQLRDVCHVVIQTALTGWNRSAVRLVEGVVGDYLRTEARGALDAGGSVNSWAVTAGLLDPGSVWITTAPDDKDQPLPNPFLMTTEANLGSRLAFDFAAGPMHGDLHLQNILIPTEYGALRPDAFRLVDLSTFEGQAPLSRDPVTLMLSVIAPRVAELRRDEQQALLDVVLQPWTSSRNRLTATLAQNLETIYRTSYEAIKGMNLGDWRAQYLLSVQATALLFTSYDDVGEAGRWWFLRLAGHAGREFLRMHDAYHPDRPIRVQKQTFHNTEKAPAFRLAAAVGRELRHLVTGMPASALAAAFNLTFGPEDPRPRPNWHDADAVISWLELAGRPDGGLPPIIIYIDRLAHVTGGIEALRLHTWITDAAVGLGLSDQAVRGVCAESNRRAGEPRPQESLDTDKIGQVVPQASAKLQNPSERSTQPQSQPGGRDVPVKTAQPQAAIAGPEAEQQTIWGGVPIRNPEFTGREAMLEALADALRFRSKAAVLPQTLRGLGGVGKTQLAVEYVYLDVSGS
jgi:hypothetical protein